MDFEQLILSVNNLNICPFTYFFGYFGVSRGDRNGTKNINYRTFIADYNRSPQNLTSVLVRHPRSHEDLP